VGKMGRTEEKEGRQGAGGMGKSRPKVISKKSAPMVAYAVSYGCIYFFLARMACSAAALSLLC